MDFLLWCCWYGASFFSVKRTRQKMCVFYVIDLKKSIFKTWKHQSKTESFKYAAGSHLQGILQGQCAVKPESCLSREQEPGKLTAFLPNRLIFYLFLNKSLHVNNVSFCFFYLSNFLTISLLVLSECHIMHPNSAHFPDPPKFALHPCTPPPKEKEIKMKPNNNKTHFAPLSFPPLKHSAFILAELVALVCHTEDLLPHQLYLQNVLCGESLNNVSWSKFTLSPLSSSPGTLTWLPSSLHVLSLFLFFIFFFWGGGVGLLADLGFIFK